MNLNWPLMENNITHDDLDVLIKFLKEETILTQSKNVKAFEEEWSKWLGIKYSVFVNSGASANYLTMLALKIMHGTGEIIVPTLTWVSDIASVIQCGFKPVFVDINPDTLCMDDNQVIKKINNSTKAVFLTHVQGFNGLTDRLLYELNRNNIILIEDVCESHGATFHGKKLGTFGLISNFSYYYAHHMSTIEGGMVCTNDEQLYQIFRMCRSHGMVREGTNENLKQEYKTKYPDLNPDFIFIFPSYNMRNTEIGAVLGRNQLKRLNENIIKRNKNFRLFLDYLDSKKYKTDFNLEGSSNYAFNLVLKIADQNFCEKVIVKLKEANVEFRRGSSGGGNQTRQPYLEGITEKEEYKKYPHAEHIHFYGFYIGNFPDLPQEKILNLCKLLNEI